MKRSDVIRNGKFSTLTLVLVTAMFAVLVGPASSYGAVAQPKPSAADVKSGKHLFEGSDRFENGAASCASCHAIGEVGPVGGGQLGPELDWVGVNWPAATIAAWLTIPPSPTMTPIFGKGSGGELTARERELLGAYITQAASKKVAATTVQKKGATVARNDLNTGLLAAGVIGAVVLLMLMGLIWHGRLRSVRAKMVKDARLPNT